MRKHLITFKNQQQLKGHWEVGDWCVAEYDIKMVKEVGEKGNVSNLSNGVIEGGGLDNRDRMFPLTLWTKTVTDSIRRYKDELSEKYERLNLNWPGLHSKFIELHIEGCQLCFIEFKNEEASDLAFTNFWKKVKDFVQKIEESCDSCKEKEVDGVRLFRR